jgi:D-amino-acid dehydrogenase
LAVGGADVHVVDAAFAGQATAAGAGIIEPWSSMPDGPSFELAAAGASYYPTLLERLRAAGVSDVGYKASGGVVVDPDPAQLDVVEQALRRRTAGVPVAGSVEQLDARQARALFPPLAADLAAVYISGAARVDGRRLRAGLLAGAQRLGAALVEGTARLTRGRRDTLVVQTAANELSADVVVVACGAWTNQVLDPLGYRLPVEPQRGQLAHLLLDGTETGNWPSVLPLANNYIVPFDGGRVVVGATRETGAGFDARLTAGGLLKVLGPALSLAPGLASASVLETRVGLRPLADTPLVGPVDGMPNVYVNTGFGALGLTMGPVTGEALAQRLLTGSSDVDLSAFAPPAGPS